MNAIKLVEEKQKKDNIPDMRPGDTVKVHFKIVEGATQRIQIFEGLCIAQKNEGFRSTITVRKISYGVGVERIFPIHSPRVDKIEIVRRGKVRRAKLYYIRQRVGKKARVPERLVSRRRQAAQEPTE